MEWINRGKYPSGMTLWEPKEKPEHYEDLTIHVFEEREGYTVSFGRHQVSRFKSVDDACKFADDLINRRGDLESERAKKADRKTKRSKKNADDLADI